MDQKPYHPSVNARVIKLDKSYEKLHAAIPGIIKDVNSFYKNSDPIIGKFMDYNEHLLQLVFKENVPEHLLNEQIDASEAVAELAKRAMPLLTKLNRGSQAKIDRIRAFATTLENQLTALKALHNDQKASEALVTQLEQELDALIQSYTEMRQFLDANVNVIQQMQALINRSLN